MFKYGPILEMQGIYLFYLIFAFFKFKVNFWKI